MVNLLVKYRTTATLGLIDKSTGATTTIYLSSLMDHVPSGAGASLSNIYHKIILDVSELGVSLDRFAPTPTTGTLILNDAIDSFGVERKFSDLLDRYEIQNQSVVVKFWATDLDSQFDASGAELTEISSFTGYVTNWSRPDGSVPTISLNIESRIFKRKLLTRTINDWLPYSFYQALSKPLPVILGANQQVYPLLFTAGASPAYVYATHYGALAPNAGIQKYYLQDRSGEFQEVTTASSTTTAVFSITGTVSTTSGDNVIAVDLNKTTTSQSYVLVDVSTKWKVVGSNFNAGINFICEIWEKGALSGKPETLIATATREYASQAWTTTSPYDVIATFPEPVPLTSNNGYFLVTRTAYLDNYVSTTNYLARAATSGTASYLREDNEKGEIWSAVTTNSPIYSIYALQFGDSPADTSAVDNQGRYLSLFYANYDISYGRYQTPDLTNLNWLIEVNGLKDGVSAAITGAAGTLLDRPNWIIKALSCKWNGSANVVDTDLWDIGANYSSTLNNYSSGSYTRTINGVLEGEVYLEDAVRAICEQSATRCYLTNSGKLDLRAWGSPETPAATISSEQCQIGELRTLDLSYVVNEVVLGYGKGLQYFNNTRSGLTQQAADFASSLKITTSDSKAASLLGLSTTLYGLREFKNSNLDLVNDSTSARSIIYSLMATFASPPQYVDITLPISLNDSYVGYQPLSVISLIHPSLPAYFGTSYSSKLPHYSGSAVDAGQGYALTRANTYRLQIEDRFLNFTTGQAPTLRWVCRILNNAGDPT